MDERNSTDGNSVLKNFLNDSLKENPNELDYFQILDQISNQKLDKELVHLIFNDSKKRQ